MVYQLRIYEIFEQNKTAFHARFEQHAARIMRTYGFDIRAMWEAQNNTHTEFVYLLTWPDESTMQAAWAEFMQDEEWKEIKRITRAEHGDLVGEIQDRVLAATGYSPSLHYSVTQIQQFIQALDERELNPLRSAPEMLTAMMEEVGEVAQEVSLLEGIGTKAQWSKPPSQERLGQELVQLMNVIFALANHYQISLGEVYSEYVRNSKQHL